jgi:hypothetical protein
MPDLAQNEAMGRVLSSGQKKFLCILSQEDPTVLRFETALFVNRNLN